MLCEHVVSQPRYNHNTEPTAMMLSGALMLLHLKEHAAAKRLQSAIETVYKTHAHVTGDVGGTATTTEFTDAVIRAMS